MKHTQRHTKNRNNQWAQTNYIYHYKIKLVTPYSDFITENSSVYVRNENQGRYTKNTHCEK